MLNILAAFFIFLASPVLFAYWWIHVPVAVYACFHINKLANYWSFWLLLIAVVIFSSEPRFSLEYFLLASALYAVSLGKSWKSFKLEKKETFFIVLFAIFFLLDFLKIRFYEKGSFLLLLPFTLSLLFPLTRLNLKNPKASRLKFIIYGLSSIAIILSNKRATLLAFLTSLKNAFSKKLLILIAVLVLGLSYLVKDNVIRHYQKSIKPRVFIYQSVVKGWLASPSFGHGYGTFALDYPPYRFHTENTLGGKNAEYLNHAHSQVFHILFENGVFGLIIFAIFLSFIYQKSKIAFYTFLITALIDMPLKSFGQFLLIGLIINTLNYPITNKYQRLLIKQAANPVLVKLLKVLLTLICAMVFGISAIGHYFFDRGKIDQAINIDRLNSLYYFERGANSINEDLTQSEKDLAQAIKLSPDIGYMQAFYAASLLGNNKLDQAAIYIDKALQQLGDDAYLHVLASFIHRKDKELSTKHMQIALEMNPNIKEQLHDPNFTADEFIAAKRNNPRLMGFYRRGSKLFLPMPYLSSP